MVEREGLLMGWERLQRRSPSRRRRNLQKRIPGGAHDLERLKEYAYSDDVRYGNCIATALGWIDITAFILNTGFAGDGECFIAYGDNS
jgi:hypothetical protein